MAREDLDAALRKSEQALVTMGGLVEKSLHLAIQALADQDLALAREIVDGDEIIDKWEIEIQKQCLHILAKYHPIAKDLRHVISILRSAGDLERMGDHASNIAETTLKIGNTPLIKPLIDIPAMANVIARMVQTSLDSFVHQDAAAARQVCEMDDEVDETYADLYQELLGFIAEGGNPQRATQAVNLLIIARFLERIADHATNIGENVIYFLSGERDSC